MHTRERSALDPFMHDGTAYARAYVEFYDSLSPEEQQSDRYRGTRDPMAAAANAETGPNEGRRDMDLSQDPLLMLFENLEAVGFDVDPENQKSFIQEYRAETDQLLSRALQASTISAALRTFRDIQDAFEMARDGDKDAFGHLKGMAEGEDALTGLSDYVSAAKAV